MWSSNNRLFNWIRDFKLFSVFHVAPVDSQQFLENVFIKFN